MDIRQVTPREAYELLEQDPAAIYLDVRTEAEFEAGHPAGARNVPVVFFDPGARQPEMGRQNWTATPKSVAFVLIFASAASVRRRLAGNFITTVLHRSGRRR